MDTARDAFLDEEEARYHDELASELSDLDFEPPDENELRRRFRRERRVSRRGLRVPTRPLRQPQHRRRGRGPTTLLRRLRRGRTRRHRRASRRPSTTRSARGDPDDGDGPDEHRGLAQGREGIGDKELEQGKTAAHDGLSTVEGSP